MSQYNSEGPRAYGKEGGGGGGGEREREREGVHIKPNSLKTE